MRSNGEDWPRDALPEGTNIYGYRIDGVLGRGGFGITYRALDRIEQLFAIKECFPRQFAVRQGTSVFATDAEAEENLKDCLDRFIREARALLQLSRIDSTGDGVVKVVTSFDTNGTAYIVMEFLGGDSLETVIKENPGGIAQERLSGILTNLLHAVGCAHDAGLLHRDIKPSNILLRENGRPVLIDFGAVRSVTGSQTHAFTQIFSESYAPLEQITGEAQGPYSDIYAIGATCYRAIGGTTLNALTRHAALISGRPDPQVPAVVFGAGRYDPPLLHAIDAALKVAAEDRLQSVGDFLAMIEPVAFDDRTILRRAAPPPAAREAAAEADLRPPLAPFADDNAADFPTAASAPPAPAVPLPALDEPPAAPPPALDQSPAAPPLAWDAPPAGQRRTGRWIALGGGLATLLTVAAAGFMLWPSAPPAVPMARLDIRTTPAGAVLRLDGHAVGTAPLQQEIKPGRHLVEATLGGYQPTSVAIDPKPGQSLREDLKLTAALATLVIRTVPPGAALRIDDQPVGAAPVQKQLEPGRHRIQASLDGYQPQSLSVEPRPGQTLRQELKLAALPATLVVSTTPPGATVSIDDQPVGAAPVQKQIEPGPHRILASLDGYQPQSLSVEPRPGQTLRQELKLAAFPATLVVNSVPPGAKVSIDDQSAGEAPVQKMLEPGDHRIVAALDGYQPQSRSVSLRAGQTLPVNLELAALPALPKIQPAAPTPAFEGVVVDVLDPRTIVVVGKGPIYLFGIKVKNLGESQVQADQARRKMKGLFEADGKTVTCYNGPQAAAAATPTPSAFRCFTKNNVDVAQWAVQHGLAEFEPETTSASRPVGQ